VYRFFPNGRKSSHVRTSFSLVDLDNDAELGMERLASAIRDWQKRNGKA
jgi:tryptophan aminotransferase